MSEQLGSPPPSRQDASRRRVVTLAGAAALAACRRSLVVPVKVKPFDASVLSAGFPALAERARPGLFALGVIELATGATWYWNVERPFPLAAAAALPIAAAALAEADARRLSLAERIDFGAPELSAPPSAIDASFPDPPERHTASIPLASLFPLALQAGDGAACDLLMKRIGGPGAVTAFLQQKGILGMSVDRYAREIAVEAYGLPTFRPAWKDPAAFQAAREAVPPARRDIAMQAFVVDKRDTATLPATLQFLAMLAEGRLLSPGATAQLLGWMAPPGASMRLAAGLPKGAAFAHVSGALPTDLGFTPAVADLGLATLPKGRRYALAAFLAGATGTGVQRDGLFADAARLAAKAAG